MGLDRSNPYMDDDADNDILRPSKPARSVSAKGNHSLDGTPCVRCGGKTHNINMPKNVPADIIDQLSDMLDNIGDNVDSRIVLSESTPYQAEMIHSFQNFIDATNNLNTTGPMIRAVAETLDKMTSGEVTRKFQVYTAEREVMVVHTVLRTIHSLLQGLQNMNVEANKVDTSPLIEVVDGILQDSLKVLHEKVDAYRKVCAENGEYPDEGVVEAGISQLYTDIAQVTMSDWLNAALGKAMKGFM